ncbi:hypothetical protein PO654_25650 [Phytobacter diazotrophicus]|jgi:hypothetical protein|uniref:hypothetical protein n=1 Tax=Phytobacter diazotrophicus TaxID=395631 RepID=UPI00116F0B93|nr:hypothetical protein [Enterobacteriaceae bacterium]VTP13865.1 hypothetical protein PUATCC27989T_01713 [Phytobacter ursingii]
MSQKNVNTAAKESKESSLSTDQVLDLFDWIMTVPGLQFPDTFTPLADSEEIVAFWDAGPDYRRSGLSQAILWLQLHP